MGKIRAIGVSNYTVNHLQQLVSECEIVPHVVQIELHPHYQQVDKEQTKTASIMVNCDLRTLISPFV